MKSGIYLRAIIAILITLSAAYYQRKTGPTHPMNIDTSWKGMQISADLTRSHDGEGDQPVEITVADTSVHAVIIFRRFKTNDEWVGMKMTRDGENLFASLPHQPPAGKLEYFIQLKKDDNEFTIPLDRMVVTRFTGAVPTIVLTFHILFMFVAMFLSTWSGLEAAYNGDKMYMLTYWTVGLLFIGGMILGPVVQKYAFGDYWTGIPWGFDLTDNKTLLAMVAWIFAAWMSYKKKAARWWIVLAAVILIVVYSIPHSIMGSELNYETMEVQTGQ
jgi:hypothetical protein